MSKLPLIGISMGDMNGVSTEVVIKALSDHRINEYFIPVVYGSPKIISYWKKMVGLPDFQLNLIKNIDQVNHKRANLLICWEEETEIKPGEASDIAGKYAFRSLEMATTDVLAGKIQALVTAPLNKHTVNSESLPFRGHTEYLADRAGSEALMILTSDVLRVALATGHVPLKDVSQNLTKEKILRKLTLFNDSLMKDFGIVKPRIGVLALNPHAGENGLLGQEEKEVIIPAVEHARNEMNLQVYGPYPADGFFGSGQHRQFDGILAMYHDQGLIPFKTHAFEDGVNFTAGLPFVRTSPDHGTGYAIAGKNQASEQSLRNALFMAADIWEQRNHFGDMTRNPLPLSPGKRERFRIDF